MTKKITEMICKNCDSARKAFVEGKICCNMLSIAKHFGKYPNKAKCPYCGEELGSYYDQQDFDMFFGTIKFYDDIIYTGWAQLGSRPNSKEKGMMTNFCYILDENNGCNYFKYMKERIN